MCLDRDSLSAMKVSQLRELCKKNGLFVSGNKTDLIDRLLGEESASPIGEPSKKLPTSDDGRGDAIDRLLARVEAGGARLGQAGNEISDDLSTQRRGAGPQDILQIVMKTLRVGVTLLAVFLQGSGNSPFDPLWAVADLDLLVRVFAFQIRSARAPEAVDIQG